LLVKSPRQTRNTREPKAAEVLLFNLEEDLGEQENLADKYPVVVSKLHTKMDAIDAEITSNARPPWFDDDGIAE
jgi:arylsulfatase A